ncbi:Serine_incorporator protein [Hexamita inflata]|uniref:Serine_incorporator protein n=1 Tax=Hexamita inflata TaxID=28002 RepID=A0ABP1GNM1_9EUKA
MACRRRRSCGRSCCKSVSSCNIKFNRIIYIFMFLAPLICNIVFMFHPDYFNNSFWRSFPAFKENNFDFVWIMNIRFVFTYFVFHSALFFFSLFQAFKLVGVAKFVHRGLLFVKVPLLVGFFFLTFVFPNESMLNFQYLMIVLGAMFQGVMMLAVVEIGYVWFNKVKNAAMPVRVLVFIVMIGFIGLGITEFAFTYLNSRNIHVVAMTSALCGISGIIIVLALVSKHASIFPVSFLILMTAFSCIYGSNFDFFGNQKFSFTTECFNAFTSIGAITCFFSIFLMNTMEISLKPLFLGVDSRGNPDMGAMVSLSVDDDARSEMTSYYYWAFHLVMIGAICYIGNLSCWPRNYDMVLTHWYSTTGSSALINILVLWTEF